MNDIEQKLKQAADTEIHDTEWLKRQEDVLRAHIRANPPRSPGGNNLPLLITGIVVVAIAGFVLFARNTAPQPMSTVTTTPTVSPATSPARTASPSLSPSPTPNTTPHETIKPTPSVVEIPRPTAASPN